MHGIPKGLDADSLPLAVQAFATLPYQLDGIMYGTDGLRAQVEPGGAGGCQRGCQQAGIGFSQQAKERRA